MEGPRGMRAQACFTSHASRSAIGMRAQGLNGNKKFDGDPATATYVAAMTAQPDPVRRNLINDLIVGLKADGDWTKLTWLSLIAAHASQAGRLNAVNPDQALIEVNGPTFTTDRGYTGNGSTSYLDAGRALGGQFTLNSGSFGTYVNQVPGAGDRHVAGPVGGPPFTVVFCVSAVPGQLFGYSNNNSGFSGAAADTGMHIVSRTSATAAALYRNGTSIVTDANAATAVPTGNVGVGRGGNIYAAARHACVFWGAGLDTAAVARVSSRILTYLTAIGAS